MTEQRTEDGTTLGIIVGISVGREDGAEVVGITDGISVVGGINEGVAIGYADMQRVRKSKEGMDRYISRNKS
jgi:hypothetical protein